LAAQKKYLLDITFKNICSTTFKLLYYPKENRFMFTRSEQFITQMKLRELRKQRELLLTAYNQLDRQLAGSSSDASRLQTLYQGLREIYFAGQALHPEVANLEPILYKAGSEVGASPDTLAFWRERLERELAGGRMRSEIVFIFAALLEEWTQEEIASTDQESRQIRASLLQEATRPSQTILDLDFLDQLFAEMGFGTLNTEEAQQLLQRVIGQWLPGKIDLGELTAALKKIVHDRYHAPATRRQAQSLLRDGLLIKEFADALNIILGELDSWNWPEEGVVARACLTPSKWRLFLNEDLPTFCLLQILGTRWQKFFEEFFKQIHILRFQQLRKATAELPPTAKVEAALRLYQASFGIKPSVFSELDIWSTTDEVLESDLWEDPDNVEEKVKLKASLEALLSRWVTDNSILSKRAALKAGYRDLSQIDGYGKEEKPDSLSSMEQALMQINAELRLGQAAFPGRPVYILKADLKDYYPSLPHELILEILARFGLNQQQLDFFRRFLQVKIKDGSQVETSHRGVPNHRRLADLLGELVMLLLDHYLRRSARVQIIRMIDDICLIAASEEEAVKAWQALERFCEACGLRLNADKCGAVCVGGELPSTLPSKLPVWSMVTLNSQGEWSVDQPHFETYLEQSRQEVLKASSLIARVETYNNSLNYLVKALAMRLRLDENHRNSVGQAMLRFQNNFFGEGRGIVEELRDLIRERFLGQNSATSAELPDGWLHWPITAGGLSLYHPLVLATGYTETFRRRYPLTPPEERPSNWQRQRNGWYNYYQQLLDQLEPEQPDRNQVMETLVRDFIQRGAEISLGGQHSLSVYWRWIVYLYGPQILERLGTFRFLITELVPAQLITGRYRQGFFEEKTDSEDDFIEF
jgi:hypothetical protein